MAQWLADDNKGKAMSNELNNAKGYDEKFLGEEYAVYMPWMTPEQANDIAYLKGSGDSYVLRYQNYSVVQNKRRRFPFFTAANIDGNLFRELGRVDRWRLDRRIDITHQWGPALYKADKSDFDKGHMTKREDVQWGRGDKEARAGALSTFYYTNAVPQHGNLNQRIWRKLEDYILKKEARKRGSRICAFTGPVLSADDPVFTTEVDDERVQIPVLFWKVVYYLKDHDEAGIYRVGFLMGQEKLLEENGIVHTRVGRSRDAFQEFSEADTYQVNVATIQRLTSLGFPDGEETISKDKIPLTAIVDRVQARDIFGDADEGAPDYAIEGLEL